MTNSNEFFKLLMLMNALPVKYKERGLTPKYILNLGYLPYARQDRVCEEGESSA